MDEKHYEILRLLQDENMEKDWHLFVYRAWEKTMLFDGVDDFNQHLIFLEDNQLIDTDPESGQYFITASGVSLYHQRNAPLIKEEKSQSSKGIDTECV